VEPRTIIFLGWVYTRLSLFQFLFAQGAAVDAAPLLKLPASFLMTILKSGLAAYEVVIEVTIKAFHCS
jgi:hypothetical protein